MTNTIEIIYYFELLVKNAYNYRQINKSVELLNLMKLLKKHTNYKLEDKVPYPQLPQDIINLVNAWKIDIIYNTSNWDDNY